MAGMIPGLDFLRFLQTSQFAMIDVVNLENFPLIILFSVEKLSALPVLAGKKIQKQTFFFEIQKSFFDSAPCNFFLNFHYNIQYPKLIRGPPSSSRDGGQQIISVKQKVQGKPFSTLILLL